jgi:hypothetical protein
MTYTFFLSIGHTTWSTSTEQKLTKSQIDDIVGTIKMIQTISRTTQEAWKFFFQSSIGLFAILMIANTAFNMTTIMPSNPLKEFEVALGACLLTSLGLAAVIAELFWLTSTLQLAPLSMHIFQKKTLPKYASNHKVREILEFFLACGRRASPHFDSLATKHLDD